MKPTPSESGPASLAATASPARARWLRRGMAVVCGALLVALAAQVEIPLRFTPVPITLQPLAVLVVGGLLGARGGAAALALYVALGAMGLPVFAGGGAGIGHLLGPTGGYLLAFPAAAAVTGYLSAGPRGGGEPGTAGHLLRLLGACTAGMLVIHAGGVAQLALLTGDLERAVRLGFVPFFTGDLLKIGLAALVVLKLRPRLRSLP